MRSRLPLLALTLLTAPLLAGCADDAAAPVTREDLSFPVASSLNGVNASESGDLRLVAGRGLMVERAQDGSAVQVGLGLGIQTSVVQTCAEACANVTVPVGSVVADAGVISLRNLSLNAVGPEGDSAIFFYDDGREAGQWMRWAETADTFQLSTDLQALGNVTAAGHVGTITPVRATVGGREQVVTITTAAVEGLERTIFLRGSAQLVNGTMRIDFPDAFAALVHQAPDTVTAQVTPTGPGATLYVAEKSSRHIVVNSTDPTASTPFDFFIQANRIGAEQFEP